MYCALLDVYMWAVKREGWEGRGPYIKGRNVIFLKAQPPPSFSPGITY
jgi:hypothetical protein